MSNLVSTQHLEQMLTIRRFEEGLLNRFRHGELRGTTHTSIGQEAVAVSTLAQLRDGDVVVSNHRCHGHFIAYGGDLEQLLREIMGDAGGVCAGIGGSQQLHSGDFYTCGVLGGTVPVATGMALAERLRGTGRVAVVFIGDGALGEGVVYESLNLAALWGAPILYVVENNGIAQSTPLARHLAGDIATRFRAFGIDCAEVEGNDLEDLLPVMQERLERLRAGSGPAAVTVRTTRLGPHSKGDDDRGEAELAELAQQDPITLARRHFTQAAVDAAEATATRRVGEAFERAMVSTQASPPGPAAPPRITAGADGLLPAAQAGMPVVEHLREVLHELMLNDERVLMIGEDIADPYGGAFKVTRGLSSRFPERVLSSPISEAGIVGCASGLALRGLRPVVEIMFGDFVTLAMDQVLNYMTKFQRMYAGQVTCPVILRTPMGGYRGYGPTHSQSLEKLFLGIPGLTVIAASAVHDQRLTWERMIDCDGPVLYVENKILYGQRMRGVDGGRIGEFKVRSNGAAFPQILFGLGGATAAPDAVVLTYGGMLDIALEAARTLFVEDERRIDVLAVSQLAPVQTADIVADLRGCARVATLEEGTRRGGWGAEVIASLVEARPGANLRAIRCAALDDVIPTSESGELHVLPSARRLVSDLRELLR